jgi:hypothetical protein
VWFPKKQNKNKNKTKNTSPSVHHLVVAMSEKGTMVNYAQKERTMMIMKRMMDKEVSSVP